MADFYVYMGDTKSSTGTSYYYINCYQLNKTSANIHYTVILYTNQDRYSNAVKITSFKIGDKTIASGSTWSNLDKGTYTLLDGNIDMGSYGTFKIDFSGYLYSGHSNSGSTNITTTQYFTNDINFYKPDGVTQNAGTFTVKLIYNNVQQWYQENCANEPWAYGTDYFPAGTIGYLTNIVPATGTHVYKKSTDNFTWTFNQNYYAYEIWTTYNTYYIKFDANGGTGSMDNETFTYGTSQALTKNNFTRQYYDFIGWNTNKNATTALYTDQASVSNLTTTSEGTVTLYAIWAIALPSDLNMALWDQRSQDHNPPAIPIKITSNGIGIDSYIVYYRIKDSGSSYTSLTFTAEEADAATKDNPLLIKGASEDLEAEATYEIYFTSHNSAGYSISGTYYYTTGTDTARVKIWKDNEWKNGLLYVWKNNKWNSAKKVFKNYHGFWMASPADGKTITTGHTLSTVANLSVPIDGGGSSAIFTYSDDWDETKTFITEASVEDSSIVIAGTPQINTSKNKVYFPFNSTAKAKIGDTTKGYIHFAQEIDGTWYQRVRDFNINFVTESRALTFGELAIDNGSEASSFKVTYDGDWDTDITATFTSNDSRIYTTGSCVVDETNKTITQNWLAPGVPDDTTATGTITVSDDVGNTLTKTINIIIGEHIVNLTSSNPLSLPINDYDTITATYSGDWDEDSLSATLTINDSNNYIYEDATQPIEIDTINKTITAHIKSSASGTAGYSVAPVLKVTDKSGFIRTISFVINLIAERTYSISISDEPTMLSNETTTNIIINYDGDWDVNSMNINYYCDYSFFWDILELDGDPIFDITNKTITQKINRVATSDKGMSAKILQVKATDKHKTSPVITSTDVNIKARNLNLEISDVNFDIVTQNCYVSIIRTTDWGDIAPDYTYTGDGNFSIEKVKQTTSETSVTTVYKLSGNNIAVGTYNGIITATLGDIVRTGTFTINADAIEYTIDDIVDVEGSAGNSSLISITYSDTFEDDVKFSSSLSIADTSMASVTTAPNYDIENNTIDQQIDINENTEGKSTTGTITITDGLHTASKIFNISVADYDCQLETESLQYYRYSVGYFVASYSGSDWDENNLTATFTSTSTTPTNMTATIKKDTKKILLSADSLNNSTTGVNSYPVTLTLTDGKHTMFKNFTISYALLDVNIYVEEDPCAVDTSGKDVVVDLGSSWNMDNLYVVEYNTQSYKQYTEGILGDWLSRFSPISPITIDRDNNMIIMKLVSNADGEEDTGWLIVSDNIKTQKVTFAIECYD